MWRSEGGGTKRQRAENREDHTFVGWPGTQRNLLDECYQK